MAAIDASILTERGSTISMFLDKTLFQQPVSTGAEAADDRRVRESGRPREERDLYKPDTSLLPVKLKAR